MQYIFPIFILGVILYILDRDYSDDSGEHVRAKIVHGILLILLIFSYFGALFNATMIIAKPDLFFSSAQPVGIFSHKLFGTAVLLETVAGLFALWFLWKMLRRDNMAREFIVGLLPILGVLKSFPFYLFLIGQRNNLLEMSSWVLYVLALGTTLALFLCLRKVYKAPFMIRFFHMESVTI